MKLKIYFFFIDDFYTKNYVIYKLDNSLFSKF